MKIFLNAILVFFSFVGMAAPEDFAGIHRSILSDLGQIPSRLPNGGRWVLLTSEELGRITKYWGSPPDSESESRVMQERYWKGDATYAQYQGVYEKNLGKEDYYNRQKLKGFRFRNSDGSVREATNFDLLHYPGAVEGWLPLSDATKAFYLEVLSHQIAHPNVWSRTLQDPIQFAKVILGNATLTKVEREVMILMRRFLSDEYGRGRIIPAAAISDARSRSFPLAETIQRVAMADSCKSLTPPSDL